MTPDEEMALSVVKQMYAEFDKGDLNAVLALQSDDVVWDVGQGYKGVKTSPTPGLPYAGHFVGKAGLQQFFSILATAARFRAYERTGYFVQGNSVVVLIHDQATALPAEKDYDTWLIHVIEVNKQGKISYLWNHIDTGPIITAFSMGSK